jgi:hypothetical protein
MKKEAPSLTFYEWYRRRQLKFLLAVALIAGLVVFFVALYVTREPGLDAQWYDRQNRPLLDGLSVGHRLELNVYKDCQSDHVLFMDLAWPIGSISREGRGVRHYVRNPRRLDVSVKLRSTFLPDAALPRDAYDTGFHNGDWHLWINPSQAKQHIYVVNRGRAEQWPRSSEPPHCG